MIVRALDTRRDRCACQHTEDDAIVCPWHHSAFDLRSGDVKDWSPWPPGVGRLLGAISREKALLVFSTRVEEGSIWVALEDL